MLSLFRHDCPDPTGYTFQRAEQDHAGLNTLTCHFTTDKGDGGDSENWSTYITYPNSSGSKYQVICEKHAAYTALMQSPCSCLVKMFTISKNIKIARTRDRCCPNMIGMLNFAPDHLDSAELFLHSIYLKSLTVDKGQVELAGSVGVKTCSTAFSKI